jgi:predicted alpha/beta hydrolase
VRPGERELTFPAADGYALSGRLLLPERPRAAVLLSAATGSPKEFYLHFAAFGVERGAACLVYDYRGVGASAPKDLRAFRMEYPDWGRLDMAAALDCLIEAAPRLPVVHVAHSVGGHLVGFLPNHRKVARHVFIGVGLGTWWKHRFPKQQLLDLFFWWVYGPWHLARHGYIPAGGLWGGSTLPASMFRTWRRWSHRDDYFRRELADRLEPHWFEEVAAPITSYVFTDDSLTTPASAREFLQYLPRATKDVRVRRPVDLGVTSLGHHGFFRRRNVAAWREVWDAALEGLR